MKPVGHAGMTGRWALVLVLAMLAGVARGEPPVEDVERLKRQVKYLAESLALARAEADALRARLDGETVAPECAGVVVHDDGRAGKDLRLVEVNEELGMAVVGGGRQSGLRPGLQLAAMRGKTVVARLRVVDVRPTIAGAVIQRTGREFPGINDRVVVATGSKE